MALFFVAMFFFSSCSKEKDMDTDNPLGQTKLKPADVSKPSANGQGALFLDYPGFIQGVQHFSFHANTDVNGNVTGSFESKWGKNGRVHGTINCLSILPDGKTAIMSGVLTKVQGDTYIDMGFLVGDDVWFKVQDSGEGANATKDRFSDFYAGSDQEPCTTDYGVDLFTILNGNIQVKP